MSRKHRWRGMFSEGARENEEHERLRAEVARLEGENANLKAEVTRLKAELAAKAATP